jgi:selenocysteine lyase/cysteine desulfurase
MDPKKLQPSRRRALSQLGLGLVGSLIGSLGMRRAQAARDVSAAAVDDTRFEADPWTRARNQLVLNPRLAYFDTAQFGPSSRAVIASQYRAQEALQSDPAAFYETRYSASAVQELCARMARWLDCGNDDLCFTRGAVAGLSQCGLALNLQSGDEVLINAQLPESLRRFWIQQARQRGLIINSINLPAPLHDPADVVMAFENAISERSKVLVCSHVQHGDGAVLPVRELCQLARTHGLVSMIEGGLSLGALQFSVRDIGCDVYGASLCHWLNGPQQTGVVYVRAELQTTLQTDFVPSPDSSLVNSGSSWPRLLQRWPNDFIDLAPQFQSLAAALSWQETVGRALIEARLRELQTYVRLRLQNLDGITMLTPQQPGMWLQLLSLRARQHNAVELANWLRTNDNVIVGTFDTNSGGLNALRISLHIYNSHDEIERLTQGLQRALRI